MGWCRWGNEGLRPAIEGLGGALVLRTKANCLRVCLRGPIAAVVVSVVYVLTKSGAFASKRASHQMRVRVNNDIDWDSAFGPVFDEFVDAVELISVETVQAAMMTELRYGVQLKPEKKTSDFMEKMQVASGNNRILLTSTRRELDNR